MTAAMKRMVIGLMLTAVLCGCGQKGALYLPSQKKAKVPPIATTVPPGTTAPVSAPADSSSSGAH